MVGRDLARAVHRRPRRRPWRSPPRSPAVIRRGADPVRLATGLACEFLFERPDYEVHDGDVRLDAVELQLTMELLRDPRRELYPNLTLTCHNAPFPGHG